LSLLSETAWQAGLINYGTSITYTTSSNQLSDERLFLTHAGVSRRHDKKRISVRLRTDDQTLLDITEPNGKLMNKLKNENRKLMSLRNPANSPVIREGSPRYMVGKNDLFLSYD